MTLLSVTFQCATPDRLELPRWTGHIVQAWFLGWLRAVNSELSTRLHDTPGRKPYTVSPIFDQSREGAAYGFRLTTLSNELSEAVEPLLSGSPPDLRLGSTLYSLSIACIARSSYEALVREAADQPPPIILRFSSPTCFHSGGLDVPLPLPSLVFASLIQAWDVFSPLPLPLQLSETVRAHVALARHQLHTERVVIPQHGSHVGFTGKVQFAFHKIGTAPDDLSSRALLSALLHYAAFAGVGVRTTAGMGWVTPQAAWL